MIKWIVCTCHESNTYLYMEWLITIVKIRLSVKAISTFQADEDDDASEVKKGDNER